MGLRLLLFLHLSGVGEVGCSALAPTNLTGQTLHSAKRRSKVWEPAYSIWFMEFKIIVCHVNGTLTYFMSSC